jgi:hypothetical protein
MAKAADDAVAPKPGQAVLLRAGKIELSAIILEDMGPLERDGSHVFRVSVDLGEGVERAEYDVSQSEIHPLS